ncbi:uncharacterized protein A4U43_C08F6320 [Asparagus officinalis]|nr:uncharacterized protein A4U43_C08F6320 [Asparagus officinalis]
MNSSPFSSPISSPVSSLISSSRSRSHLRGQDLISNLITKSRWFQDATGNQPAESASKTHVLEENNEVVTPAGGQKSGQYGNYKICLLWSQLLSDDEEDSKMANSREDDTEGNMLVIVVFDFRILAHFSVIPILEMTSVLPYEKNFISEEIFSDATGNQPAESASKTHVLEENTEVVTPAGGQKSGPHLECKILEFDDFLV